ncbi:MAG: histidinol-phosphatase [Verrucomicrobiota bacterium JB022]|nr:histidinol-phosphatase [Verrucomicrobiota bacterium JB022]
MHTPLCGHARGTPQEFIERAQAQQLNLLTFTCHIPMENRKFGGSGIRMRRDQLPEYLKWVDQARELGAERGIKVLTGIEAEVFPDAGEMNQMDEVLQSYPFDFILGSLHHHLPAYRDWLNDRGKKFDEEIIPTYFAHLSVGALSGRYHSLSHPDVIRLYGTLRGTFLPQLFEKDIRQFLETVKRADVCLEVNTSGLIKGDYVVHPDPIIMTWAAELGIPFTIGSDSHAPEQLGQHFDEVVELLRSKGIHHLHYFEDGQRIAMPLESWTPLPTSPDA